MGWSSGVGIERGMAVKGPAPRKRSGQADLGQNALACQQLSAQADDETEHGQAAIPGFSEGDETKAGG